MLARSRILQEREIVIIANTNSAGGWQGEVLIDRGLNAGIPAFGLLFSNLSECGTPGAGAPREVTFHQEGEVVTVDPDGEPGHGPVRTLRVALGPSEFQILAPAEPVLR